MGQQEKQTKKSVNPAEQLAEWKAAVAKLDEALDKQAGNMAAKLAEAKSALADRVVPFNFNAVVEGPFGNMVSFPKLAELAEWATQTVDEYVTEYMTAHKSTDKSAALKEQRSGLVDKIRALVTLGLADESDVPASRKGRSGGTSSGTRTVKTSAIRYSRKRDGENEFTPQPDGQNSLSSLAFYFTKGLRPDGSLVTNAAGKPDNSVKLSAKELESIIRKECNDIDPYNTAFEITLKNGYSLKAEVLTGIVTTETTETPEADETVTPDEEVTG